MCLMIHKPAAVEVPVRLLESAAAFNPHGFGVMVLHQDGRFELRRRSRTRVSSLLEVYEQFRDQECVIHFRYGTSGDISEVNTHPIRVTRDVYVAHSGTIEVNRHQRGRSDTWHFVHDYLRPLLKHRPEALHEAGFQNLVRAWTGPNNKFVFMDARSRHTVIINRDMGVEIDGLWLSGTRWFDASQFEWYQARSGQPELAAATFLA